MIYLRAVNYYREYLGRVSGTPCEFYALSE